MADTAWIAPTASVIGDVVIGEHASVWYNVVLRADTTAIHIGAGSNVQDGSIVHGGASSARIGSNSTIGHGCIVHGATVGDHVLVANGTIVLDDAVIGNRVVIAAGSLVTPNSIIPDDVLALGRPARVQGPLSESHHIWVEKNPEMYRELARRFAAGSAPIDLDQRARS